MSKIHRGRPAEGEELSAGRVEYLEQARQRVRMRRLRRTVVIVALLAVVVAVLTGAASRSIARLKDFVDTVQITFGPDAGWPQQTGVPELMVMEPISGGFVELGEDSCVVYSLGGSRLNYIQSGYARPALAVGKNRFVLYNRSGNELRVESRTQNLYTKTMENSIYLCAVADDGQVAVVTEDVNSAAKLTVYSASMEQKLSWSMTSTEGVPLRMAFAPDSRRIAVASVTADGGQLTSNLYLLSLSQGDPVLLGSSDSVPQWVSWMGDAVLVVYEHRAALYNTTGGERASYEFGSSTLASVSQDSSGAALLLNNGQTCTAVMLDKSLNVQYAGSVPSASCIVRSGGLFYLLTDDTVECFDQNGVYQWNQTLSARPQALLAGKQLLVFCGNTVQTLTPPEQSSSGS